MALLRRRYYSFEAGSAASVCSVFLAECDHLVSYSSMTLREWRTELAESTRVAGTFLAGRMIGTRRHWLLSSVVAMNDYEASKQSKQAYVYSYDNQGRRRCCCNIIHACLLLCRLSSLRQKVFLEENKRERVQNSRKSKKNRCREEIHASSRAAAIILFHIAEAFRYLSSYIIDA
jgi:hypothetical protein